MECPKRANTIIKPVKLLAFAVLLVITYFFINSCIKEYMRGATYFISTKRSLSEKDIPTVTVCFETSRRLAYGKDLEIQTYLLLTESVQTLKEGSNDILGGSRIHLKQLFGKTTWFYDNCWAMNFEYNHEYFNRIIEKTPLFDKRFYMGRFRFNLINKKSKEGSCSNAEVILTSQKNSYGATLQRWYEGHAKGFGLQKNKAHLIKIASTTSIQYLTGTCSMTFFECVALKLKDHTTCKENNHPCAPISLPTRKYEQDFPICSNNTACWEEMMANDFPECMKGKACLIQEYNAEMYEEHEISKDSGYVKHLSTEWNIPKSVMEDLLDNSTDTFGLGIKFDPDDSSRGERTKDIEVNVFTEQRVWTAIALIGNIGGQMGLLVGFSFFGCFGWMLNMCQKSWERLNIETN